MNCVQCRREIADGSNFCPYCGTTQPAGAPTGPGGGSGLPPASNPVPPAVGGVRAAQPDGTYSQGGVPQGAVPPGASQRATVALILSIASLVLGVFGVFCLCWCYGIGGLVAGGLGVAGFLMARNELEDIAAGFASPGGQGMANAAKVMGIIGMIGGVLAFLCGLAMIGFAIISESGNF